MQTISDSLTNPAFNAILELEFAVRGGDYADPQLMPADVRKTRALRLAEAIGDLTDDEVRDYAAYRRLAG